MTDDLRRRSEKLAEEWEGPDDGRAGYAAALRRALAAEPAPPADFACPRCHHPTHRGATCVVLINRESVQEDICGCNLAATGGPVEDGTPHVVGERPLVDFWPLPPAAPPEPETRPEPDVEALWQSEPKCWFCGAIPAVSEANDSAGTSHPACVGCARDPEER